MNHIANNTKTIGASMDVIALNVMTAALANEIPAKAFTSICPQAPIISATNGKSIEIPRKINAIAA